ncbi:18.8 kDa class II heat shock protein-like [Malania oleifera]|uniref:18.8 kDa class II heat shock protein-like n=1 Tax=Malania oleifera TaxID=397392 RepID=UPI0025AE0683|nr:18.8 kDa class II heat shock protein-like [Malania oleifera]
MDLRDFRNMGFDAGIIFALQDMLDFEIAEESGGLDQSPRRHTPSRAYVRDAKAMAATPADVKEYPESYVYVVDMPGIKPEEIKAEVGEDGALVVSGERRRDKEKDHKEGVKYVRMERRQGKFMRRFMLPENANADAISAVAQDGVLIVTVEKKRPEGKKKARCVEVKVG